MTAAATRFFRTDTAVYCIGCDTEHCVMKRVYGGYFYRCISIRDQKAIEVPCSENGGKVKPLPVVLPYSCELTARDAPSLTVS